MTATSERVDYVLAAAEREFHLVAGSLHRNRRRKTDVVARRLAVVLLRDYFGMSSTEIGAELSMDHSSVVHHWSRFRAARDRDLERRLESICAQVIQRYPQDAKGGSGCKPRHC